MKSNAFQMFFGENLTFDELLHYLEIGIPCPYEEPDLHIMNHEDFAMRMWRGDTVILRWVQSYLSGHKFPYLSAAGKTYHWLMRRYGFNDVNKAREFYESKL